MISIDRTSRAPLHEQVAEQVRYEIATGHYSSGDLLPSTRSLADRLGLSYHTIRAAYRVLESEGMVTARAGSGYRVREQTSITRADRMEHGATVVQSAMRKLVGMGLDAEEMEYLFQEQLDLLAQDGQRGKLIFAGPSLELATLCAEQLSASLHRPIEPTALNNLGRHRDADCVITAFDHVRQAMEHAPRADVRGVSVHLNDETLERVTRLLDEHTLCIVSHDDDSIPPLVAAVRTETRFGGQMVAFSAQAEPDRLSRLISQSTLVLFTPSARRPLLAHLKGEVASVAVRPVISPSSLVAVRSEIP